MKYFTEIIYTESGEIRQLSSYKLREINEEQKQFVSSEDRINLFLAMPAIYQASNDTDGGSTQYYLFIIAYL